MGVLASVSSARRRSAASALVTATFAALAGCAGERAREARSEPAIDRGAAAGAAASAGADAGAQGGAGAAGDAGRCPTPPGLARPEQPTDRDTASTTVPVQAHRHFAIHVVDADTGAPLAGARLVATHRLVLVSDRNGAIAFYEPGLMDTDVWFEPA